MYAFLPLEIRRPQTINFQGSRFIVARFLRQRHSHSFKKKVKLPLWAELTVADPFPEGTILSVDGVAVEP